MKLMPLQVIVRQIVLMFDNQQMTAGVSNGGDRENLSVTIRFATIMVATIPVLTIYPFMQKYFVKGVMVGGIKG